MQQIKDLREQTGAGISDVKRALEESGGDEVRALEIIQRKLGSAAVKKAGRETGSGIVDTYVHSNGRIGAMVEILCETDFVARTPEFKAFAHEVSMHIAAMQPVYTSLDAVPKDIWEKERTRFSEEAADMDKPADIKNNIIDGKLTAYFGAVSLLEQSFIKEQDKTVAQVVNEAVGKFGENIKIGQFARFEI